VILDACVVIAALDAGDPHHTAAAALLAEPGALRIHEVNLGEALVAAANAGLLDQVRRDLADAGIEEVHGPGHSLARIRAETRLRMPDCCVLLAAESTGDDTIATFDHRLASVALRRGLRVLPASDT